MLYLWLLSWLVQVVVEGGVYSGAPPQLLSSAEAHGPLARLALDSMAAQYYNAPLASAPLAATPLAVAAPVAPVDLVHHVPAVVDVPVTKYSAHPGFVQKIIDIPRAKVATAKLQIRRPAIQKQFYDIEQRTIVRPAGSAVVELEEPLSKTLVSPFTVGPAGHHTVAQYQQPFSYPVASYPFVSYAPIQIPTQSYPSFVQQTPAIVPYPPRPQQPPPLPQQPPQQIPSVPEQPEASEPRPPQQFPSFPRPPSPPDNSVSNAEFDSSDTVVVDNADFGRSANELEEQSEPEFEMAAISGNFGRRIAQEQTDNEVNQQMERAQTALTQQILDEFQGRQLLRQFLRQNDLHVVERFQQPRTQQRLQQIEQPKPVQIQPQTLQRSQEASAEARESLQSGSSPESPSPANPEELPNLFRSSPHSQQQSQRAQIRNFYSQGQITSTRNLSPEESQDNQQKLIELLTGGGKLSEVSLSRSGVQLSPVGDSGVVRGRVLSVTPAPTSRGGQGEERVSTRRVVVSRPIQTLEEVDVHQPFTKLERVAVHQPALLKTAHTHIARVPTAVPVVTPTLAPVLYH